MNPPSNRPVVALLVVIVILLAGIIGTLAWLLWPRRNTAGMEPAPKVAADQSKVRSETTASSNSTSSPSNSSTPTTLLGTTLSLLGRYTASLRNGLTDGTPADRKAIAETVLNLLDGFATTPENPSFPLTIPEAHRAILEMIDKPLPLSRPLVIVGGYEDLLISQTLATQYFGAMLKDPKFITVSLQGCGSFDDCRARILAAVNNACGNTDPHWTAEVDVVGVSLGGMAARFAAAPSRDPHFPQRLRIARLFTLSSPLAGAKVAMLGFTSFQRDIQPGSEVQKYLAAAEPDPPYDIYSYVHLDDEMVGQENAAIPGRIPYWLPNVPGLPVLPHEAIMLDERVFADVTRRLRGETPFTLPQLTPLPQAAGTK